MNHEPSRVPFTVTCGYGCAYVSRSSAPPGKPSLLQSLKPLSVADVVLITQQFMRAGNWQSAQQLCEQACGHWGRDTALTVARAVVELGVGQYELAEELLHEVLSDHPEHLVALYSLACLYQKQGDAIKARDTLFTLVQIFADYPGALSTLATVVMPGPTHRDVLAYVHQRLRPRSYLELGVEASATLKLAQYSSAVVGVGPRLSLLQPDRQLRSVKLFACTSNEFFERQSPQTALNGLPLELVFIASVHQFESALRDFCNTELWASQRTVVVMHDVLPLLPIVASRVRQTTFWSGDTWKVLWGLIEHRPDLTINIIPAPPSGLAIIRDLDPEQALSDSQVASMIEQYSRLEMPELEPGHFAPHLPLVENSVAGWCDALGISEYAQ